MSSTFNNSLLVFVISFVTLWFSDVDSPRSGYISILPRNLHSLGESLRGR